MIFYTAAEYGPAWPTWLTLLADRGEANLQRLFGDGAGFAIARITLGLSAGRGADADFSALVGLIHSHELGVDARAALMGALTYLTAQGRFARAELLALVDAMAGRAWADGRNLWAVERVITLGGLSERRALLDVLYAKPAFRMYRDVDRAESLKLLAIAAAAPKDLKPL